ncbi:hypothetical protein V6N13_032722 [Hibiscus sabdariffa]|uniref:Transmembrane protein n=1 Tax=Hibiscus sabdariffa TaxID=183260 RepID=A0ABR2FCE2_9ROSI
MGGGSKRWAVLKKESWRWKYLNFKWKRLSLRVSFIGDLMFRVASLFEAVYLLSTLCFFYLCCGCQL